MAFEFASLQLHYYLIVVSNSVDNRIYTCMLPYHQHALVNDLASKHKQDRARRGPNVITQRANDIVDCELDLLTSTLTPHQIDLYLEFWARNPSDLNLLPMATVNNGRLHTMETTDFVIEHYRRIQEHHGSLYGLLPNIPWSLQKTLFLLAFQITFSEPPSSNHRTPPNISHTVSWRPLSRASCSVYRAPSPCGLVPLDLPPPLN